MGTRGTYGFFKKGENKLTYSHSGSYPEGLGSDIVNFIKSSNIEELNKISDDMVLIEETSIATKEQIEECIKWYDDTVSDRNPHNWYCLLRKAQGNLNAYKQGLRYMINGNEFIKESLFCEYGYIINLDENVLEIYEGFQREPNNNRYSCQASKSGYYNCKLVYEFALMDIPNNWLDILVEKLM